METSRRERARPMSPDERRAAIVRAARPLFLEHGQSTSTRLVAEAAGIAEGTVFRAFATKQDLVDAVLDAEFDPDVFLEDLDEPLNETFRATTLTLGWDGDTEQILVEARAETDDDDEEDEDDDADAADATDEGDDPDVIDLSSVEGIAGSPAGELLAAFEGLEDDDDGPDTLRVRLTVEVARSFVNRALEVVAAGRMPCPLCGQPLDPQGHICPRRNGHYVN